MEGKVALVTGSSKGIGKAIAITLAENGVNIVINYSKSEKEAQDVVEEIKKKNVDSIAVKADVSNKEDVERMFKIIQDKFGKLDILVNNAGITKDRTLKNMSGEEWLSVINTNLNSAFYCSKAALGMMGEGGSIINISSVVGISGNFGQCNYAAAKAGLIGFTKSVAKEAGKKNITVNAIAPGFIETEMTDKIPFINKQLIIHKLIPLGRMGKTKEVAELAVFLASEQARYITGEVIKIDGGLSF